VSTLIHIEASPRKERSHALRVGREFLQAYRDAHPGDTVETLDVWSLGLPEFDGAIVDAKYRIMHGEEHTAEEAEAWRAVVAEFERFTAGDRYLFSVPMWNFGIPYKLKQWIDVITQPGLAFGMVPGKGLQGLVRDRPAVVIYSRGGAYGADSGTAQGDFQKSYFDSYLRFIGFEDIENILVEPTQGKPEHVETGRSAAIERARSLATAL
jgi:FMN-dependent NADH-azoreductase